jgi:Bacterial extracellular solute-binding proteins, family 5 Middle
LERGRAPLHDRKNLVQGRSGFAGRRPGVRLARAGRRVTAATLTGWHGAFLAAGEAALTTDAAWLSAVWGGCALAPVGSSDISRRTVLTGTAAGLAAASVPHIAHAAMSHSQLTWALHVSVPATWLDPADTLGIISPFMIMYALYDAMVKPMLEKLYSPSLAESWTTSEDNLTYEFTIRQGAKFHNGEPVAAEDVKF